MAEKEYHSERTTGKTLEDLYRVARSIDGKVEKILEQLEEANRCESEDYCNGLDLDDYDRMIY
ncbi:hypothetical protein HS125_11235 [bacterium]|nr:hypothetical protein [bacterium]